MIRAEDRAARDHAALHRATRRMAAIAAAQPRTSMPAHIVEGSDDALAITDDENTLADDIEHQIVPGLGQLLLAAGAIPFAAEDPLFLQLKRILGVIPARWQRLLEPADGRSQIICVHFATRSLLPSSYNSGDVARIG